MCSFSSVAYEYRQTDIVNSSYTAEAESFLVVGQSGGGLFQYQSIEEMKGK
jgi:hypothetical protein